MFAETISRGMTILDMTFLVKSLTTGKTHHQYLYTECPAIHCEVFMSFLARRRSGMGMNNFGLNCTSR